MNTCQAKDIYKIRYVYFTHKHRPLWAVFIDITNDVTTCTSQSIFHLYTYIYRILHLLLRASL